MIEVQLLNESEEFWKNEEYSKAIEKLYELRNYFINNNKLTFKLDKKITDTEQLLLLLI